MTHKFDKLTLFALFGGHCTAKTCCIYTPKTLMYNDAYWYNMQILIFFQLVKNKVHLTQIVLSILLISKRKIICVM
jgi:hypothetical protein